MPEKNITINVFTSLYPNFGWRVAPEQKNPDVNPTAGKSAAVIAEDLYSELREAYNVGKQIQLNYGDVWVDLDEKPLWGLPPKHYRIKPESPAVHPRQAEVDAVRKAYNENIYCQWQDRDGTWCLIGSPTEMDWFAMWFDKDWDVVIPKGVNVRIAPNGFAIRDVKAAYKTGKQCEWRFSNSNGSDQWYPIIGFDINNWLTLVRKNHQVRIKPEFRLRPWKPEEVVVGALIHWRNSTEHTYLIVSNYADEGRAGVIKRDGIKTYDYRTLANYCDYSIDGGKTWNKCGVQEAVEN